VMSKYDEPQLYLRIHKVTLLTGCCECSYMSVTVQRKSDADFV